MTRRRPQALAPLLLLGALACSGGGATSPPDPQSTAAPEAESGDEWTSPDAGPAEPTPDEPEAAANPTAPTQAPAPASDGEGRLAGITEAHNKIRAELGIAPLTWSPELAAYAQSWADKLAAGGCGLRHRPESGADRQRYGENIFGVGGYDPSADEVVASWAEEVANYDAKKNRCRGVCGHYTQIVWRKSQRLGCAMASCGDSEIWVCNYDPAGNYVGERPY
ncbi:MAG: SCP-like extracellular [Myxococcales bacterium]|nr:SCP-like extracellular [Myxococcales bacterium]